METDIKWYVGSDNIYDIDIVDGDIASTNSFETALQMSLLLDKRAISSEKPRPQDRRGWFGNLFNRIEDYNIGSKLWLLSQARNTQDTENRAVDYVNNSLQWLIEDGHATNINVSSSRTIEGISIFINIERQQDEVTTFTYNLWNNTLTV